VNTLASPTPDGLPAIAGGRSRELRFLAEAFDRLSREYPSTRDGRPYLGDTWSFSMMDRMVHARIPLLHAEQADRPVDRDTNLRLTDVGATVLAGAADHVTLNGIDRWIGGVRLRGHHVPWRWNDATETITHA